MNRTTPHTRSLAREIALLRLFAQELGGEGLSELLFSMLESEAEAEREEKARKASNPDDEAQAPPESARKLAKRDLQFVDALCNGVALYQNALDETIASYATDWSINRMDTVDLCLLRIASYEIFFCDDIPVGASINDCVELAKRYGGEKSYSFVNGILGSIARSNDGQRPVLRFRAREEQAEAEDAFAANSLFVEDGFGDVEPPIEESNAPEGESISIHPTTPTPPEEEEHERQEH